MKKSVNALSDYQRKALKARYCKVCKRMIPLFFHKRDYCSDRCWKKDK